MNYTVIPKDIIGYKSNSKLLDIYTYTCIKSTMNYKNGISKINQKTLSEIFDIPERTLCDSIRRLQEQKLFKIERKRYRNESSEIIRKNYYHFKLDYENYFFVLNNFLKLNLPREVKGFLLILKAICLNNSNVYISTNPKKINKSELSRYINMDIKTIDKYLNQAKDLKEIAVIDNRIILKSNYFPLRVKEDGSKLENRKTEIINTIQEICNKYNVIMPLVSDKVLDRILVCYPLLESDISEVNNVHFTETNSLEYILDKRITSLPVQFNEEYILKILNINKPDKKEITNYKFILD